MSSRGGGARGGRDQFSWDDVKADHHRTNYLGNSIKAQVGRHTRDVDWFKHSTINSAQQEAAHEEIRSIQAMETANIAAMLGTAVPIVPPLASSVVRSPPRLQLKSRFVDAASSHVSADVGDHNGADTLRELESLAATIIRRNERRLERQRRRHEERARRRQSSSRSPLPSDSSLSSPASSASPAHRQRTGRSRHHSRHRTRTRSRSHSHSPKRHRRE